VLRLRRGVSGLIAVLVLGLVMVSLISTAVTLSSRLQASVEESSSRASRVLSDASQPPVLSLYASEGALYVEVIASRPLELKGFIVELPNSVSFKPVANASSGVSRFKVVEGYGCEPVRVHLLLASGLVTSYNPRFDPRIGFTPKGWDGWWRCGLLEGVSGGRVYDPRVWIEAVGLGGGGNDTIVFNVGWRAQVSSRVRIGASVSLDGYTWGECSLLNPRTYVWSSETVIGGFSIEGSRVDVVLGCVQGWPVALYLAFRGPQDVVYSGRVEFSYSVTYRTQSPPTDGSEDPGLEGPLPVAYTPIGSSSYTARRSWWIPGASTIEWAYEGSATLNYRMSTVMVLLAWAYMRPDPFIGFYNKDNPYVTVSVSVSVRVDNATKVKVEPVTLDLGASNTVRVKLYKYNITPPAIVRDREPVLVREQVTMCTPVYGSWGSVAGYECKPSEKVYTSTRRATIPEPFSHSIYKVYQTLLPGAPRVEIVASTAGIEVRRAVEPGKVAEISLPGARVKVEAKPHVHPPLFNGITASYRDVNDRVREYTGGIQPAPSLSPWRGPALVEVELPETKLLAALSWPGALTITQANTTYKGYAQLVGGKPYTVTPNVSYRVAKALVDSKTLAVVVEQTLDPRKGWTVDLNMQAGSHAIITITPRNPYEVESIIAWVN
jgi:hypothetical protein